MTGEAADAAVEELHRDLAAARRRVKEFEDALPYTFALESALRGLYECAVDAHWPLKAEHMLPMMQARACLEKKDSDQ